MASVSQREGRVLRRALPVFTAVLAVWSAGCALKGPPRITSAFGSIYVDDFRHVPRGYPHTGVDYQEARGAPVLAPADGVVVSLFDNPNCGLGLVIEHGGHQRWTRYCHLQKRLVTVGQAVIRGQRIALVGDTGEATGYPHLHLELWIQLPMIHPKAAFEIGWLLNPESLMVGCFDPERQHPKDRLVLTYPVGCGYSG